MFRSHPVFIVRVIANLLGVIGILSAWLFFSLASQPAVPFAPENRVHLTKNPEPKMLPPASSGWSLVSDGARKSGRQLELSVTGVGTDSGTVTRKLDHIGY